MVITIISLRITQLHERHATFQHPGAGAAEVTTVALAEGRCIISQVNLLNNFPTLLTEIADSYLYGKFNYVGRFLVHI